MAIAKYKEWLTGDNLLRIEAWVRDGLTDEQVAHNMGIAKKTLSEWKQKYSEISTILKRTKEVVDIEVENALYKRATGWTVKEVKEVTIQQGDKTVTTTTTTIKELPGDTTAQIYWLKNRKRNVWRDKPVAEETKITFDDGLINALKDTATLIDDNDFLPDEESED